MNCSKIGNSKYLYWPETTIKDGPVDVRVWINKYFSSRMSCVFPSISDDF
jgi:hypothetical protein